MSSDLSLTKSDPGVLLADSVVTPLDLGKLLRELFAVNEFLTVSKTKSASKLPYISPVLQAMVKDAGLNLLDEADRQKFDQQLQFVRRTAPTVQISFASDPSKQALRPIIRWFRENGHPNTLLSVGVQPNLGGGCVVRTSTKNFDFSLQKLFKDANQELAKSLSN